MKSSIGDDLWWAIHQFKYDMVRRRRIQTAVCDAIEGFCEGRCEWFRASTNGPAINALIYRPMWHPGYFPGRHFLQLPTVCQYCKHETFERFDILKEEGV